MTATATRPHILTPVRAPAGSGVTYHEVRSWAVWLQVFTASDLADALGADLSIGERGVRALLYHGICTDTGDVIDGPDGSEAIVAYVPLPPGPNEHETAPPEWARWPAYSEVMSPRGLPVRIRTQRDLRGGMSTPGSRQKLRNRERAYQRQEEARERRAEEQQRRMERLIGEGKWKTVKRARKNAARTYSTRDEMSEAA